MRYTIIDYLSCGYGVIRKTIDRSRRRSAERPKRCFEGSKGTPRWPLCLCIKIWLGVYALRPAGSVAQSFDAKVGQAFSNIWFGSRATTWLRGTKKLFWHVSPYGNYQEYSTRCENLKTRNLKNLNLKTSRSKVSNAGERSFNQPWPRPSYPTHGVPRMGLDEDEASENRAGFQGWEWD